MQEKYDGQSGSEDQLKQTNVTFLNDQSNPSGGNYFTQLQGDLGLAANQ